MTDRGALLEAVSSRELCFIDIAADPAEMTMQCCSDTVIARRPYTHIFAEENGRWRPLSAQGTQLAGQQANRVPVTPILVVGG